MQKLALSIILLSAIFAGGCWRSASSSGNNNSKNARASSTPPEIKTSAEKDPSRIRGAVVHISDGDTFIMQDVESGERITIRIHAIDAPELAQDYGKESREHLRALIANQTVEVRRKKTDQFRRIVGAVFLNGKDIGLEMVDGGYAWHFKQYQKEQPPDERQAYASAEATALYKQLGLWRDARPVPPWEYRRQHQRRK
jgi:endonuclease YncB( thermonuclease family)